MPSKNWREGLGGSQDMEGWGLVTGTGREGEIRGHRLSRKETRAREEMGTWKEGVQGKEGNKAARKGGRGRDCY